MPCPGVAAHGPAHKHTYWLNNETNCDVWWAKKTKGFILKNESVICQVQVQCRGQMGCRGVQTRVCSLNIDAFISVHAYFTLYSIWVDTMCQIHGEKMLNNVWCPETGFYRWRWTGWMNCQDTNTSVHEKEDTRTNNLHIHSRPSELCFSWSSLQPHQLLIKLGPRLITKDYSTSYSDQ